MSKKFAEIREITNYITCDYLKYYFKGDTAKQRFDDFNNGIELF